MGSTSGTIFLQFDPIRVGLFIFSSRIISFLAVCTSQGYLNTHRRKHSFDLVIATKFNLSQIVYNVNINKRGQTFIITAALKAYTLSHVIKNRGTRPRSDCAARNKTVYGCGCPKQPGGVKPRQFYSTIEATTPAPTVRPPSRMAKRRPSSMAMGVISSISMVMLSPGITISTPSGNLMEPVTSVVRK